MTGGRGPSAEASEAAGDTAPTCSNCGSPHRIVDPQRLEVTCADCGLVLEDAPIVATSAPRPAEAGGDGSGRGIGPFTSPSRHRRSLGSTLSGSRDGQGRPLDWRRRYEFQHLRRVMQRQTSKSVEGPVERSQAPSEIEIAGQRMELPTVIIEEAERIFREGKARGLFRGRNLPSSVGATLYAACRRYSIPRTLAEIARGASARRSEVGRVFKLLRRGLERPIPSVGARAFLARYAEELALSHHVRSTVEAMLEEVDHDPGLSGLSPHGVVAALIYLASEQSGERRSRAQVARVSAVTEVTLRSTSRLLTRLARPRPKDAPAT
ncbi:MAG: transcription initiation factor IIB family protein [Thermoplasmata archaeon]|nr:transcription initiation factor IIB family protein [Thermoplasmata archaeon]